MKRQGEILLRGSNLWYLAEGMFGPLFAIFSERIGGDILSITSAWATYLIVSGLLNIAFGRFSDRGEIKERLMVAGYALNALFTFGYLFVSAPWHLFLVQAGLGVASAMATPTWNALFSRFEEKKASGYAWGMAEGQSNIITGVAIVLGGLIVSQFSFTVLFATMGTIQVFATVYQARILKK
jgi:predicted MFS family arabinose efflux permease